MQKLLRMHSPSVAGACADGKIRFTTVSRRFSFAVPLMLALTTAALGQGKLKNKADKEPPSQTLPAQVELPTAVAAETARLTFHVAPLSSKGLLLQQTRDALKELMQANHGGRMVKLRAFVAGTGDARRVREIVSEVFSEEAAAAGAGDGSSGRPAQGRSASGNGERFRRRGQAAGEPRRAGVFSGAAGGGRKERGGATGERGGAGGSRGGGGYAERHLLSGIERGCTGAGCGGAAFPAAAMGRDGYGAASARRLRIVRGVRGSGTANAAAGEAVQLGPGAALVSAPKLIFTGAQMAFGEKEADLRLAFERLEKSMEPLGVTYQDVVFAGFYPVSRAAEAEAAGVEHGVLPQSRARDQR